MSKHNGHGGAKRTRAVLRRTVGKQTLPISDSSNAMMIRRLMATRAMRGRPDNFVVIVGSKILDCAGTFEAVLTEGGEVIGDDVLLVHKRDLAKIVGKKASLRFWDPDTGRVDGVKPPGALGGAASSNGGKPDA